MSDELGPEDFVWRVTKPVDGKITIAAGDALSSYPPELYLPEIGNALIEIGTFMLRSRVDNGDEDDDFYDDED